MERNSKHHLSSWTSSTNASTNAGTTPNRPWLSYCNNHIEQTLVTLSPPPPPPPPTLRLSYLSNTGCNSLSLTTPIPISTLCCRRLLLYPLLPLLLPPLPLRWHHPPLSLYRLHHHHHPPSPLPTPPVLYNHQCYLRHLRIRTV